MWHERAAYGHFFYRIPNGESAADAYDRVSGFNESLWRSFGEDDFPSVCVLVTHGLMTRVFLMKWYHWSVEYFEDLRNINHCEFIVMRKSQDSGKFILQNKLRTWTELKRDRELAADAGAAGSAGGSGVLSPIPMRKRWGDARSDEDELEEKKMPQRQNTVDLFRDDDVPASSQAMEDTRVWDGARIGSNDPDRIGRSVSVKSQKQRKNDRVEALKSGRDGGGSESGASEEDDDGEREESPPATAKQPRSMALALQGKLKVGTNVPGRKPSLKELRESSMDMTDMADALGDQSENEDECRSAKDARQEEEDFKTIQEQELSFTGSVR